MVSDTNRKHMREIIVRHVPKDIRSFTFYGVRVGDMDREELYGLIGWVLSNPDTVGAMRKFNKMDA